MVVVAVSRTKRVEYCDGKIKMTKIYFRNNRVVNFLRLHGARGMRLKLAQNTSDPRILTKLARGELVIKRAVVENPNTPLEILGSLSYFEDKKLAEGIIKRPEVQDLLKSANSTAASPEDLAMLLQSPIVFIKEAVAKNPNCPEDVLGKLLKSQQSEAIKKAVAENPTTRKLVEYAEKVTSLEEIAILATNPILFVREALERNPVVNKIRTSCLKDEQTSYRDYRGFLKDIPLGHIIWDIRRKVAENTVSEETLRKLVEGESDSIYYPRDPFVGKFPTINAYVARNPHTPEDVLHNLAKSYDREIREAVAGNPSTPLDVLGELTGDELLYVKDSVIENPTVRKLIESARTSTSPEDLTALATNPLPDVMGTVARNPYTPQEVLRKLAEEESYSRYQEKGGITSFPVSYRVAQNPNAPLDLLLWLATKGIVAEENLVESVSKITSFGELTVLATNQAVAVRIGVAKSFHTPVKILAMLADDPSSLVRSAVAEHPNTPEDILGRLVNDDPDKDVREAVANNPRVIALIKKAKTSIDPDILFRLAQKPFPCVRTEVARNLFCPIPALEELAEDPRWLVKLSAAKNPNTPPLAVAKVLREIRKDQYKVQTRTETRNECVAACHDGERWEYVDYPVFDTRYGYVSKSLETAREILGFHAKNQTAILHHLKELNPELYEALTKSKT